MGDEARAALPMQAYERFAACEKWARRFDASPKPYIRADAGSHHRHEFVEQVRKMKQRTSRTRSADTTRDQRASRLSLHAPFKTVEAAMPLTPATRTGWS